MARFDAWLDMQLRLVDDGAIVSTIVLEGPDGAPWGTWPRGFPALAESIEGIIGSLARELPRGKHACRLVSLSSDKAQLSAFPLVVVGGNSDASEATAQAMNQQRATALALANLERAQKGMDTLMIRTAELTEQVCKANDSLYRELDDLRRRTESQRTESAREQGKQDRLNALFERVAPLLDVAMGLASQWVADYIDSNQKTTEKRLKSAEVDSVSVHAEQKVADLGNGNAASQQPIVTCDTRVDSQPDVGETTDNGRRMRDRASSAERDRVSKKRNKRG